MRNDIVAIHSENPTSNADLHQHDECRTTGTGLGTRLE
ncbi:MAG: hypothetical protein RLZZ553_1176 [Verrucomicrobiota bacterium]|jgi:hypothetical protein